jgi:DNA polymerase-1
MDEISALISRRIEKLTVSIIDLAGTPFNINSPKQLGEILFEKLGLKGGKKNKNGYSTSADILEKLKHDHPIIEMVLEYRMLVKLKGTYIDGLPAFVSKDKKIRAHLKQTIAATGRLSCVDPNLQNIPIRKEPGRSIRKAFIAESDDYILMGADYSQIELRILADLSGDESLIEDFRSGADIHTRTAVRVFGLASDDEVSLEQRSGAKAVNFGIIYGMSSFGLSEELSITRKDAERYINDYFNNHPAVKEYMDGCIALARKEGYTKTIFGRMRPIPEINASQYMVRQMGERLAMNSPIQGSAADIIKIAMNRVHSALKAKGLESTLILQVHDELILQVRKGEEETAEHILKTEMENAAELKVPLEVEVITGLNWYELV